MIPSIQTHTTGAPEVRSTSTSAGIVGFALEGFSTSRHSLWYLDLLDRMSRRMSLGISILCVIVLGIGGFVPYARAQDSSEQPSVTTLATDSLLVAPQSAPVELTFLEQAFARGDAAEMMKYAAKHLDITLFGSSDLYSRSQAGYVLKAFFDEYRPEELLFTEMSGSQANWFAAGSYWYVTGESHLAVYLRLRRGDFGWELREIRIGRMSER